jgi:hypothetical protein
MERGTESEKEEGKQAKKEEEEDVEQEEEDIAIHPLDTPLATYGTGALFPYAWSMVDGLWFSVLWPLSGGSIRSSYFSCLCVCLSPAVRCPRSNEWCRIAPSFVCVSTSLPLSLSPANPFLSLHRSRLLVVVVVDEDTRPTACQPSFSAPWRKESSAKDPRRSAVHCGAVQPHGTTVIPDSALACPGRCCMVCECNRSPAGESSPWKHCLGRSV